MMKSDKIFSSRFCPFCPSSRFCPFCLFSRFCPFCPFSRYNISMIAFILKLKRKLLLGAILLYAIVFSAICLWKYGIFGYDAMDLAIFNQVFWNTSHGRLFVMSIHPHSYLGDHAGIIILPLSLLYALFRDPRTLLVLQTAALAAAAYPVWLIAERRFRGAQGLWRLAPLIFGLAWLANPLVHNINLFEFHLLPFALVPLLFAYLAYDDGRKIRFILLALLAMLVREDVAMVVAGFGILAAIERKSWWWRVVPIALGAAWFAGALALISRFTADGGYKFAVYYAWLGGTPTEMAANAALHPLKVLAHLISLGNLEMLLGFGLPLLFLPYLSPAYLVLAAGPFAQIILGSAGGSSVVLETHYSTLFLPALFIAAISALERESRRKRREVALGLLVVTSLYAALVMGPLPHALARMADSRDKGDAEAAQRILSAIPPDAPVAACYRLLPQLSSRESVYSNRYLFLGVRQFATGPYETPDDIEFVAFDSEDLWTYATQIKDTAWASPHYAGGRERLGDVAVTRIVRTGDFTLYASDGVKEPAVMDGRVSDIGVDLGDGTVLLRSAIDDTGRTVDLLWELGPDDNDRKRVRVELWRDGRLISSYDYPLIDDLHQPAGPGDAYVQSMDLMPDVADLPTGRYSLSVALIRYETMHILDGIRSTTEHVIRSAEIGGTEIGWIDL